MRILSNTSVRIIVSLIAIPVLLTLAYLGNWYFTLLVLIINLLSFYEFGKLSEAKGARINMIWGMFGIITILINKFVYKAESVFTIISLWFLILILIELYRKKGSSLLNIGSTTFGFFFFSLSGFSLIGIREIFSASASEYSNGAFMIFAILGTIWICDSAAFFGGTKFGKHKLFPRVSPNKSWEGAIFGFLASILSMILFKVLLLDFISFESAILISLIIGTLGQIGDLIESLLKRDAGIKDSSNLIPGHGGVFDRFDSLFFASPFIYFYLLYSL